MTTDDLIRELMQHLSTMERQCSDERGTCVYFNPDTDEKCLIGGLLRCPEIRITSVSEQVLRDGGREDIINATLPNGDKPAYYTILSFLQRAQAEHDDCADLEGQSFRDSVRDGVMQAAIRHNIPWPKGV